MQVKSIILRFKALLKYVSEGANLLSTICFNFKILPFDEAIHLPFILYGKVDYHECTRAHEQGGIRCCHCGKLKFGSWKIGCSTYHLSNSNQITRFAVKGTLILGERGKFYNGSNIEVQEGGELEIGTGTVVGSYSRIICFNHISIGDGVNISWECQIFDTNFHYYVNPLGIIRRKDGQVVIEDNVWIGNRVSILKNSVIPNNSIVASNSLVNKNFSDETYGIIAGIPAVLIKKGYRGEFQKQRELNEYFLAHPNEDIVSLREIENLSK